MRKSIFILLILSTYTIINSQQVASKNSSILWGSDIVIDNEYANSGKFHCIQAPDGRLYAAIIDNTNSWKTISYYISRDLGDTWTPLPFLQEDREMIKEVKLVAASNAVFSFYQTEDTLKIFNITQTYSNNYFRFPYSLKTWDAVYCSYNQSIYLLYDRGTLSEYLKMQVILPTSNEIKLGHSFNVMEWGNNPKMSVYQNKIAMCFYVGRQDPISNREVHYSLATVTNEDGFTNSLPQEIIPNAPIKTEIDIAIIQEKVYLLFVEQTGSSLDIRGVVSFDDGKNFSPVFNVSNEPDKNEFWIDLSNEREFNLSYFEETVPAVDVTNEKNKIAFKFDQNTTGISEFSLTTYASSNPPYYISYEPKPILVPITDSNGAYDCGIVWAGLGSNGTTVFWDRFLYSTDINASEALPSSPRLYQNYPNPFNPSTIISYQLPSAGFVSVKIYDVLGNVVRTLVNEYKQAGSHNCEFRIEDEELSSGIYFYQIIADKYRETKKMVIMK